jgi:hypothetical protein
LPTAPFILASSCTAAMRSRARCRRASTLASSLPTVVGLAVWPCVRLSIGTAGVRMRHRRAAESTMRSSAGSSTCSRGGLEHQRVAGVVDVLAGAGEVHELAARLASSAWPLQARLDPVLDRLDVVVGGLLDVLDGLRVGFENSHAPARAAGRARPPDSGANSAKPASDRAMNHSTSTCTRRCMSPNSDSSGRSGASAAA